METAKEKAKAESLETLHRFYADTAEQVSRVEAAQHAALQSLSDDPKKATDLLIACSEKACAAKNQCYELTEARFDGHGSCSCTTSGIQSK